MILHSEGEYGRSEIVQRQVPVARGTALAPTPCDAAERRTGEIRLEVKDPSGAAMEAAGTLQNVASRVVRNFRTDAEGAYTLVRFEEDTAATANPRPVAQAARLRRDAGFSIKKAEHGGRSRHF